MKHLLLTSFIFCLTLSTSFSQVEMVSNGTFEDTLIAPWGGYADGIATVEGFRVDSQAYEGTHAGRIWDHTWGVFLWNDVPGFTDSADYAVSFWYKGEEPMKFTLAIGRDLGYDLVSDVDNIVPEDATVEDINAVVNGRITWPLPATDVYTQFTFTWGFTDWLGTDPETGDIISATCAFMFENTSYAVDNGPSSYIDNVSIIKTDMANTAIKQTSKLAVDVYPNPANNSIYIKGITAIESLQIINTTGQIVKKLQHLENNSLDITSLPSGMYYINIFTADQGNIVSKFIKE